MSPIKCAAPNCQCKRKPKQYWAVGLNFKYSIVVADPNMSEWGSVEGPFKTLMEAKLQVRKWIAGDRSIRHTRGGHGAS